MTKINVKEKSKDNSGKKFAKQIRNEGWVPAVVYGEKKDPIALSLNPVDFVKQLNNSEYKKNQIFELCFENDKKVERVITKEIKVNPINNQFIHIDFLRVDDKNPIELNVPIRVEGISKGQRLGGVLVKPKGSVTVKCLPADIPVNILVDVSELSIGDNIRTQDLNVTGSQKIISNPKDILVKVESTKISKSVSEDALSSDDSAAPDSSDESSNKED